MVYEAKLADLQTVKNMVHRTIKECYPECFSENVVDFFLNLHSEEAINGKRWVFGRHRNNQR